MRYMNKIFTDIIGNMYGLRIITDERMVYQVLDKYPRKKSNRRWMKKYLKKYGRWVPQKDFLFSESEGTVICHPAMAKELAAAMQEKIDNETKKAVWGPSPLEIGMRKPSAIGGCLWRPWA